MIIIQNDNGIYTINGVRAETWLYDDENNPKPLPEGVKYVVNEDSELGQKMLAFGLWFELVEADGELVDVTAKERPEPPEQPGVGDGLTVDEIDWIRGFIDGTGGLDDE